MARATSFGPVGILIATGAGTGIDDKRMVLSNYAEAYLTSVYIVLPASQGPIWGFCVLRTAGQNVPLDDPGWIRGDPNFGGSDYWFWTGKIPLVETGGNEIVPLLRNDSGATVTARVGGTLYIVME